MSIYLKRLRHLECNVRGGCEFEPSPFPHSFSQLIHFFKQTSKWFLWFFKCQEFSPFILEKDENIIVDFLNVKNPVPLYLKWRKYHYRFSFQRLNTNRVSKNGYLCKFYKPQWPFASKKINRDWLCDFYQTTWTIFVSLSINYYIVNYLRH